MKPFLYIAMDFMNRSKMMRWAETLAKVDGEFGFKINDDYLTKYSTQVVVPEMKQFGKKLFPDKKMFKGTRRMINSVQELAELGGCEFTNIFALVGPAMLKKVVDSTKNQGVDIFALTVLTHMNDDYCQQMFQRSLLDSVRMFTEIAHEAGCSGVVLPGTCLSAVADIQIKKLCPGFRPSWYKGSRANPQSQKVGITELVQGKADYYVAGSPIFDTKDPLDSLKRILDEEETAYSKNQSI